MKSLILVAVVINVLDLTVSSRSNVSFLTEKSYPRIVGGYQITIEDAPWIVQINYKNRQICAGSLVSATKVLSAAHCTMGRNAQQFDIRAGATTYGVGGQVRKVSKKVEHPNYSTQYANDISILFLKDPLQLSSSIGVIDIAKNHSVLPQGTEVTINGWGVTCETCSTSRTLRAVKVPTVDNDRCSRIYEDYVKIEPSMLCCGLESGGKDSCQGDSGGPVTLGNSLVGIVSFGLGCARPRIPGVYTRVSSFTSWIKQHL